MAIRFNPLNPTIMPVSSERTPLGQPTLPQAIMRASRQEWPEPVELQVKHGAVPDDLYGHVFIAGTVGFGDDPYGHGTPIFNGDGMIYRLDFVPAVGEAKTTVRLSSKLAKTPCFYADQACQELGRHGDFLIPGFAFQSLGFGRFSPVLGLRNEANTAFLPFQTQAGGQRLLITYDAGRPYELDPDSLELVTPIGTNSQWKAETPFPCVFPPMLSTAHPVADAATGEVFMINYGRSVANILGWLRRGLQANRLPKWLASMTGSIANIQRHSDLRLRSTRWLARLIEQILKWLPSSNSDFTRLIRWNGSGDLEVWTVTVAGQPVVIQQTVHQMGLSRDYIIFADTAFQFGLEQVIMNPAPESPELNRLLQKLLLKPQDPNTNLYIVKRSDLDPGNRFIEAKKIRLEREIVHYVCDYDNPDQQLRICAAHNCASDVSVPIHPFDELAAPPDTPVDGYLAGMVGTQMDIGMLGHYTIDLKTDTVKSTTVTHNICTWGVGLFTHQDTVVSKHKQIYWQSLGYWPQLQTASQLEVYRDYPYRTMAIQELLSGTPIQRPASLFRLDVETMAIADYYPFPETPIDPASSDQDCRLGFGGCLTSSPQFVPRRGSTSDDQTDGYILCPVTFENCQEIWIFDAQRLKAGPLCRLGHAELSMGYTIHTTWLPSIEKRTATYNISLDEDYPFSSPTYLSDMPPLLKAAAQDFFDRHVRPHFPSQATPRRN